METTSNTNAAFSDLADFLKELEMPNIIVSLTFCNEIVLYHCECDLNSEKIHLVVFEKVIRALRNSKGNEAAQLIIDLANTNENFCESLRRIIDLNVFYSSNDLGEEEKTSVYILLELVKKVEAIVCENNKNRGLNISDIVRKQIALLSKKNKEMEETIYMQCELIQQLFKELGFNENSKQFKNLIHKMVHPENLKVV